MQPINEDQNAAIKIVIKKCRRDTSQGRRVAALQLPPPQFSHTMPWNEKALIC